ncbi:hypothetical protein AB0N38_34040 [Micromonospora aurantiaca]|uniref:Uncharacterized protein n=1 Tax=Micromonospora aurantiaca (nom. illeg.) TaxID=47850 RepID=A0A6N3K3C9_9ACTN|nr:hypothetical protein [Micromonospora aurantiaca]AXH91519.1 hypothetical protein DVH21_17205 [Micromonospora aurantiaca]
MSEHSLTVVRLDSASSAEREEAIAGVRDLLLARGVILHSDRRDALWQPSEWKPGPGARSAMVELVDWFDGFLDTANNGVDICGDRDAYHPVENDEPPRCPHCSAGAPMAYTESYGDWLHEWLTAGREPVFGCDQCGWSGLVGDWGGQFGVLIGAPAVTFYNWPPLSPAFTADIRGALGGRTGVVASHW